MKPGHRFIHVGFRFVEKPPPAGTLEAVFNNATDWMRYSDTTWILYTSATMETWRDRIRAIPGITENTSFFLVEFKANTQYDGYMLPWMWEWLQKHL